jgi:hypothetical protein
MKFEIFEGKSNEGRFQQALADAIQNAEKSSSVPDDLVTWRLRETKGEKGGIAGLNTITVTIEASFSSR